MVLCKFTLPLVAGMVLVAGGCSLEADKDSPLHPADPNETSDSNADTALAWFDLLAASIDAEDLNPPEASRRIGYAGVTLYEAVVPGMPDHRSLGEQLNGLGELPEAPEEEVHWPAIANAALAVVLTDLFAGASPATLQAITDLESQLETQFATEVDQDVLDRSIAHGQDVAAEIVGWIAADGYALWNDCPYTPPTGNGLWEPTPPGFASAMEPCWGNLRPFTLLFGAECATLPPPPFSFAAGSPFAVQAQEVYDTVNNLTPEQMEIATFWEDGADTLTPPGHWVRITSQVLLQEEEDLDVAAEAYAKVGIAVADAYISAWEIKYTHNLLRPVTYIQDPAGPISDAGWSSFITTPPSPEFTSGHSVPSGAASFLLNDLLGDFTFTDDTHAGAGLPARSFDSFIEAADEAALSRLYGGISYRAGIERGLEQGYCIAQAILQNLQFHE